jgi:hypothetical protein
MAQNDSVSSVEKSWGDSVQMIADNNDLQQEPKRKKGLIRKIYNGFVGFIRGFSDIDTLYIEPQHYKFSAMLMTTYNFENYTIKSKSGQQVSFSPETKLKIGPYVSWSLLAWGYTIDLAYISANKKKEFELSVYTSRFGLDFLRRSTGSDYRIRSWGLDDQSTTELEEGIPFDGLEVSITGLNAYYILNHRKFSYPAAFNQSPCQRRSAGSLMFGGGYTRHSLELDYMKLKNTIEMATDVEEKVDSGLLFDKINYMDFSLSAGYGYNWVFSKNWLLSVSLAANLGYKTSEGIRGMDVSFLKNFSFHNFSLDGVGRFGVIWNDSKWFFGTYGVVHSYRYKKSQFETSNYFGNINVYIGFNFGRKKNH